MDWVVRNFRVAGERKFEIYSPLACDGVVETLTLHLRIGTLTLNGQLTGGSVGGCAIQVA